MPQGRITRRQFTAGALAAGAMAAATPSTWAKQGANEKIRTAVIGCRNRGWKVAWSFHNHGSFEVAAIADCDEAMFDHAMKELEKNLPDNPLPKKPKFLQDFRKVLDDKSIDAVAIVTPDHWHALMTVMALEAGKHVYLEKPASYNIADGKAMVAAQKKHPNLTVCVGTQQRSGQHFKDARQFIKEGGLGDIAFARAWLSAGRHQVKKIPNSEPPKSMDYKMWIGPAAWEPYNEQRVHYNWHFMKNFGTGDAGNWGAHYLDIIRWYMDLDVPTSACSFGGQYVVDDAKEWPDTQTALYKFDELTVVWELRHWTPTGINGRASGAEIRGNKGTMIIDRGGWEFHPQGDKEVVKHGGSAMGAPHTKNFADCVKGNAKPAACIEEGHKTAIMCHLANISSLYDRQLNFDPKTQSIKDDPEAAAWEKREYRDPWEMPKI